MSQASNTPADPAAVAPAVGATPTDGCPQPKMRADARRNRERIIAAARAVFAEKGTDAQMDDVASAAGVGVGTVYRHFANKDAIVGELLTQKFRRILEHLEDATAAEGDPGERLLACLGKCAASVKEDLATQHALSVPQDPAVWKIAAPTLVQVNALAGDLIREGKASGTIRADMKVTDIRLVMGGVAATMADPSLAPQWRRHLQLVLDSLRAPSAREDSPPGPRATAAQRSG